MWFVCGRLKRWHPYGAACTRPNSSMGAMLRSISATSSRDTSEPRTLIASAANIRKRQEFLKTLRPIILQTQWTLTRPRVHPHRCCSMRMGIHLRGKRPSARGVNA